MELQHVLNLPMLRYRMDFHVAGTWDGATAMAWRGTLGHVLAARTCQPGACDWRQNRHVSGCAYPLFFPSGNASADGRERVLPFALDAYHKPDGARVELGLFGRATSHANTLAEALVDAGQRGVGPHRNVLRPTGLWHEAPPGSHAWTRGFAANADRAQVPPTCPACIHLHLLSPLRIRLQGRYRTPQNLAPADLLQALLRRTHALLQPTPVESARGHELSRWNEQARAVRWLRTDFSWQESVHHSQRQHARMRMGGVVGKAVLDGVEIAPLWPLLWIGQWLHAGKGSSYGFGAYRLCDEVDVIRYSSWRMHT